MKKYIILLATTLFSIIAIGTYTFEEPSSENLSSDEVFEVANYQSDEAVEAIVSEPMIFIARNLDGYIAIFVPDQILPCLVTDINVKTLPLADQELLKTGIIIDEDYGLAKFIEDYSS